MLRDLQHGFVLLRRDAGVSTYRDAGRLCTIIGFVFSTAGGERVEQFLEEERNQASFIS
jgi:hypothetical protein